MPATSNVSLLAGLPLPTDKILRRIRLCPLVEYLCKWKGLVYADATWEEHDTIAKIAQPEIDAFITRSTASTIPHKSAPYTRNRPAFTAIKAQPSYLDVGGQLKEFQITGLNWLAYLWCRHENGMLADEVRGILVFSVSFST